MTPFFLKRDRDRLLVCLLLKLPGRPRGIFRCKTLRINRRQGHRTCSLAGTANIYNYSKSKLLAWIGKTFLCIYLNSHLQKCILGEFTSLFNRFNSLTKICNFKIWKNTVFVKTQTGNKTAPPPFFFNNQIYFILFPTNSKSTLTGKLFFLFYYVSKWSF